MTKRPKNSGRQLSNIVLTAITLGIVGAVAITLTAGGNDNVDDKTGCRLNGAPPAVLAIMIDETDALSGRQSDAAKKVLRNALDKLPACGVMEVFSLDNQWDGITSPVLKAVRPPRTSAEIETDATDGYLEAQYEKFKNALNERIGRTLAIKEPADTSPILELINAIARDPVFAGAGQRELVIVSDMLVNTASFKESQNATVDLKAVLKTPYFKSLQQDFTGVDVSLFYVDRDGNQGRRQTPKHREFSRDWFERQHARISEFTDLPR
jgi:hypothetical protein